MTRAGWRVLVPASCLALLLTGGWLALPAATRAAYASSSSAGGGTVVNAGCTLPTTGNANDNAPPTGLGDVFHCGPDPSPLVRTSAQVSGFRLGLPASAHVEGILLQLDDVPLSSTT